MTTETEYNQLSVRIETLLQKAIVGDGFNSLTADEGNELARLSLLAEAYEDRIPLMPTRSATLHL